VVALKDGRNIRAHSRHQAAESKKELASQNEMIDLLIAQKTTMDTTTGDVYKL
jgi:hypothetical protein